MALETLQLHQLHQLVLQRCILALQSAAPVQSRRELVCGPLCCSVCSVCHGRGGRPQLLHLLPDGCPLLQQRPPCLLGVAFSLCRALLHFLGARFCFFCKSLQLITPAPSCSQNSICLLGTSLGGILNCLCFSCARLNGCLRRLLCLPRCVRGLNGGVPLLLCKSGRILQPFPQLLKLRLGLLPCFLSLTHSGLRWLRQAQPPPPALRILSP
mmetsp:Transcript_6589/g.17673  ORF Transcript_6589/g.17673 Transcript_6589/m.17673 type:complete len:212 (-) Transcript_6589:2041-2676(-)